MFELLNIQGCAAATAPKPFAFYYFNPTHCTCLFLAVMRCVLCCCRVQAALGGLLNATLPRRKLVKGLVTQQLNPDPVWVSRSQFNCSIV
jgi:hypothetical protein